MLGIIGLLSFIAAGIFSAEMDSAFMAFGTIVVGLLTLQYGFGIAVWAAIIANPLLIVAAFFLNIMAGGVYTAVWRWPEFIRNNKQHILSSYDLWVDAQNASEPNSFDTYLESGRYTYNASSHKERLATWVFMWMFSLVWELSRKPVIWLAKTVYAGFGGMFQKIGLNTARKLHNKK